MAKNLTKLNVGIDGSYGGLSTALKGASGEVQGFGTSVRGVARDTEGGFSRMEGAVKNFTHTERELHHFLKALGAIAGAVQAVKGLMELGSWINMLAEGSASLDEVREKGEKVISTFEKIPIVGGAIRVGADFAKMGFGDLGESAQKAAEKVEQAYERMQNAAERTNEAIAGAQKDAAEQQAMAQDKLRLAKASKEDRPLVEVDVQLDQENRHIDANAEHKIQAIHRAAEEENKAAEAHAAALRKEAKALLDNQGPNGQNQREQAEFLNLKADMEEQKIAARNKEAGAAQMDEMADAGRLRALAAMSAELRKQELLEEQKAKEKEKANKADKPEKEKADKLAGLTKWGSAQMWHDMAAGRAGPTSMTGKDLLAKAQQEASKLNGGKDQGAYYLQLIWQYLQSGNNMIGQAVQP